MYIYVYIYTNHVYFSVVFQEHCLPQKKITDPTLGFAKAPLVGSGAFAQVLRAKDCGGTATVGWTSTGENL